MNLYEANKQWQTRPADQRFASLEEMHAQCKAYADNAAEATVNAAQLRLEPTTAGDIRLLGTENRGARLTHWSFGQLCGRISAPANYVRSLPAAIAADCLNHGLKKIGGDGAECQALFHSNGDLVCRALTSNVYTRIWNYEVIDRLLALDGGWRVPPARPSMENQPGSRQATEADCLQVRSSGLSIKPGDWIAPAGLYASDHDMFAFMVNEENRIDDGSEGGLGRGFFVSNSEVGAAALRVTRFLYRYVCGNHIVWDAKDVQCMRVFHIGQNDRNFGARLVGELTRYADESASEDEARVLACKRFELGGDKDEVLDRLFGLKILPRKTLDAAFDRCIETESRLSPRTVWGMVQGITSLSQSTDYTDDRVAMDAAAGRVMSIAF